jgi:FkbM family methyltransferase
MSSNFSEWTTKYGIPSQPLVHAGAHYAEERYIYQNLDFEPVFWIEALPSVAEICKQNLSNFPKQNLLVFPLGEKSNEVVTFYVAGEESSASSMLEPCLISASHPEVSIAEKISLKTTTLDTLFHEGKFGACPNYGLILDLQGAEGMILRGGQSFLSNVSFIVTEVSTRELYRDGTRFDDLTQQLDKQGFSLLASEVNRATGWGDALYIRRSGMCSNILEVNEQVRLVKGPISVGTFIRSALVRAGFPLKLMRKVRRR